MYILVTVDAFLFSENGHGVLIRPRKINTLFPISCLEKIG